MLYTFDRASLFFILFAGPIGMKANENIKTKLCTHMNGVFGFEQTSKHETELLRTEAFGQRDFE